MSEKVISIESSEIRSNDAEVAECFNEYFFNVTNSLDIDPIFKKVQEKLSVKQIVFKAMNKYKDHPSIKVINQRVLPNSNVFQSSHVSPTEVMRQIDLLTRLNPIVVVFNLKH